MPTHHEKRTLPYTAQQMFNLVADVEHYQEFLPWCISSRVNWRRKQSFNADVVIGYGPVREAFNSTVMLTPHSRIDIQYQSGPFRNLKNYWAFEDIKNGKGCKIEFYIEFAFKTSLLNGIINKVFAQATTRMVNAFEERAKRVYA